MCLIKDIVIDLGQVDLGSIGDCKETLHRHSGSLFTQADDHELLLDRVSITEVARMGTMKP